MRAVLQRVTRASVRVDDVVVGAVGRGLVVLVGAESGDTDADMEWVAQKIATMRIFEDEAGKMGLSVADVAGSALIVSQFTLLGDCRKGRRPAFTDAMAPGPASALIDTLVARVGALGVPVQTGRFGADMAVELVNDGPVTLIIDSRTR